MRLLLQSWEFHVFPGATWSEDSKPGEGRALPSQPPSLLFAVTSETTRPGPFIYKTKALSVNSKEVVETNQHCCVDYMIFDGML